MDWSRYLAVAHDLADAAGEVVRRHFRTPVTVETKADRSPVTIADREAEAAMRRLLAERCPDHRVIGEEYGDDPRTDGPVWCLDPIDGTKAFITGRPMFGTLIALLADGEPVLGLIDQPITRDRWVGCRGWGARFNDRPMRPRACPSLEHAIASTTSPDMFAEPDSRAAFDRLRNAVALTVYGGDCIGYALMASGFSDLVVEAGLKVYDYLPLVPVLREAGADITDWNGRPLGLGSDGRVLATGDRRLQEPALNLLRAAAGCGA